LPDPLVLVPDARFGGGGQVMIDQFVDGARALGRDAVTLSSGYVPGLRAPHGRLDAANQLAAGRLLAARLRDAGSVWVVSTSAPAGYAALRSGRPYCCWVGTGLADEWAGRRPGLALSRRLAIRANAPILRRLEQAVLKGATEVFATSPWSRTSVAQAGMLPEERVGILPIPVDLDHFAPASDEEWKRTLDEPVLAFVGRADDSRKNVRLLLDVLPALPEVRLLLIGTPPRVPLGNRVETTGVVPSVGPHLRLATLFVLTSHQEGFGIAVAEALAAGLPVVTTPCGGPEALVRQSGGGVVLSGFDRDELASTIRLLLGDPNRLETMRSRGREHVLREHSPSRFRELLADALARQDEP